MSRHVLEGTSDVISERPGRLRCLLSLWECENAAFHVIRVSSDLQLYTYLQASTEFLVIIFRTNYRHFWNQACVCDHGVLSTSLLVVYLALLLSYPGSENVSFLVLLFLVSQHISQGLLWKIL